MAPRLLGALLVLVAAGAAVSWLMRPVETAAGELARFRAGMVYFKLARKMPGYCQQGYAVGVVGAMGSSFAIALDKAHDIPWIRTPSEDAGVIAWSAVPAEAWRLYLKSLDGLFHDSQHRCPLPRPSTWTRELVDG